MSHVEGFYENVNFFALHENRKSSLWRTAILSVKGFSPNIFLEIEGCENEKKFEQYQRISIKEIYLLMHNMSDGGRL